MHAGECAAVFAFAVIFEMQNKREAEIGPQKAQIPLCTHTKILQTFAL